MGCTEWRAAFSKGEPRSPRFGSLSSLNQTTETCSPANFHTTDVSTAG